jgi:hypothetical protein
MAGWHIDTLPTPRVSHARTATVTATTSAMQAMRSTIRDLNLRNRTDVSLADIARIRSFGGWIEYYGRVHAIGPSSLSSLRRSDVAAWVMRKFKRFRMRISPFKSAGG